MRKNSAIISGMVLGTLTLSPMAGWSQTSPGTAGPSGSATQQDQQRPKGTESSAGRSSMDSMKGSSASGQWSREDVKSVQEALKGKGHDPGPIDGVMGARTQQALRAFQRAQNIQTSGQLDSSTASALGVTLSSSGGSTLGGSNRGSSGTGSVGSGTSSGPNRDSTTIEPNEGNPRSGGSSKSGSTPDSSSRGSSGTGSVGSGTSSGPNRDSTTIPPNEGNPKDGGSKSGSSK